MRPRQVLWSPLGIIMPVLDCLEPRPLRSMRSTGELESNIILPDRLPTQVFDGFCLLVSGESSPRVSAASLLAF